MAEWSKALALGASPQGRGFEPHFCHFLPMLGRALLFAYVGDFRQQKYSIARGMPPLDPTKPPPPSGGKPSYCRVLVGIKLTIR